MSIADLCCSLVVWWRTSGGFVGVERVPASLMVKIWGNTEAFRDGEEAAAGYRNFGGLWLPSCLNFEGEGDRFLCWVC